jgi:hypothetical protein
MSTRATGGGGRRLRWVWLAICAAAMTSVMTPVASGAPAPRALRLISGGGGGALFGAISADGSRAFFGTSARLLSEDEDNGFDIYQRDEDGSLQLVSTGPSGNSTARFLGASADGSRAFFDTTASLLGEDGDNHIDVYEHDADGSLRLVTAGPSGISDVFFDRAAADGSRVLFHTTAALLPGDDNDTAVDVYEHDADGSLRLVTAGPSGNVDVVFAGATPDGSRVFFRTRAALLPGDDNDIAADVYERDADGSLRLVTAGPSGNVDATFAGATADGSRAFFETAAALIAADDDLATDVYERDADGSLQLISSGPSGDVSATFAGATADAGRIFFDTRGALLAADDDVAIDVYERDADGSLQLISSGPSGDIDAVFDGASADSSRVFFRTAAPLLAEDGDSAFDVYEHDADGSLSLVSAGPSGNVDARFADNSADGRRVFFQTAAPLLAEDHDNAADVYEQLRAVPSFAGPATVTGTPAIGATLACTPGEIVAEDVTHTAFAWLRDGTPISGADSPGYAVAAVDLDHSLACRVTVTNPEGSGSQTSPALRVSRPASADLRAPNVRILTPRCPAKLGRTACRRYRGTTRAWTVLRGSVQDPAPSSGIARVEVNLVNHHGSRCRVYDGHRFTAAACRRAASRFVRAAVSGARWRLRVHGLRPGRYTLRVRAVDRAGNATRHPVTRTLRLR